jgi:hypothetical protein
MCLYDPFRVARPPVSPPGALPPGTVLCPCRARRGASTSASTEYPWGLGPPEGMKIRTPVASAKAGAHAGGFPLARE